ncbi:YajQ family cyclic di-GMP-binding protein [Acidaminococcus fermentans]|uniref:YajQ family cyclic di-GMP-binding protein n=1 Tax=Acidaminococcus fermentans TaxID=905 RepID=UPI002E76D19C|nr:YajQ family cyclic di-GMP-binding protein [Acidaminococcus fermentans]MEE0338509.1 YajQ family cyclic di-GMP-binding protein [Acidaminococcus fermentans]
MAKNSSFDIVSQIDMQELDNALNQTRKEIEQRYDFRGSNATIELADGDLKLAAEDEYKLGAILDILRQRMAKRGLSLRSLDPGKVGPAAKGTVRQTVKLKQGIDKETAKKVIAAIKGAKIKVTTQQQDDQIRVSGPKKDDLQAVIQLVKGQDFGIDMQFINMR